MIFTDKLRKIRDEAGISQEYLAEKVGVSRQAVAKWEMGATMPDIDNLLLISDFFQVSIDYLLKEESYPDTRCEQSYENNEVIEFLVSAKQKTYAAGKSRNLDATSSRLHSTDLFYEEGNFKYLDTYIGGSHFSGEEVVWYQEKPIWAMNYSGRTLNDKLGNFLKESNFTSNKESPISRPRYLS